jgi:YHS domain-containing protein
MIMAMLVIAPSIFAQHEGHGSHAKKIDAKAQTACPLTGKPIDKEVYADHDGKRVYFCCADCRSAFEKDPEKVISKLEAEGIRLEMVNVKQALCPVMGGRINKKLYSVHEGKKVYFCCPMCKPKFEKNPAKYIKEMEAGGIELETVNKAGK